MAYDADPENLWIRALNPDTQTYEVYLCQGHTVQIMLTGLQNTYDFAVNPITHSCLIADYDRDIVYRIQPDGVIRHTNSLPGEIYEVVVQTLGNN